MSRNFAGTREVKVSGGRKVRSMWLSAEIALALTIRASRQAPPGPGSRSTLRAPHRLTQIRSLGNPVAGPMPSRWSPASIGRIIPDGSESAHLAEKPVTKQEPSMRTYYDILLTDRTIAKRELEGEAIVKAGRYLIAK